MAGEKDQPPKTSAATAKAEEAAAEAEAAAAVNYDHAGPSSSARANEPPPPAYEPPAYEATMSPTLPSATSPTGTPIGPTISAPFNFPSEAGLPSYDSLVIDLKDQKPIAIPQSQAVPTAGFVPVYPTSLLKHGITKSAWMSFLDTVSAFLTAKVSDRAVSHAGDMAKHLAAPPTNLGKEIYSHTKGVGNDIAKRAKKGDVFGAAFGAIGGVVSIPVLTALGIVGAAASLPGVAIGAIVKKPRTPGQRAAAYAAVANKKWLHGRGLHAQMLDSNELAQLLGVSVLDFLKPAQQTKDSSAGGRLQTLEGHIAPLEVQQGGAAVELDTSTIWMVLVPGVPEELAETTRKANSDSEDSDDSSESSDPDKRQYRKQRRLERREERSARRARRGKRTASNV